MKNNFEEFSYFQENYGVFTSGLLGLFLCSALISVGNCVARKLTQQSCPYYFGADSKW